MKPQIRKEYRHLRVQKASRVPNSLGNDSRLNQVPQLEKEIHQQVSAMPVTTPVIVIVTGRNMQMIAMYSNFSGVIVVVRRVVPRGASVRRTWSPPSVAVAAVSRIATIRVLIPIAPTAVTWTTARCSRPPMICVRNRSHRNDQCKHARQRDRDPIHDFPFPSSSLRFRSLQDSQPHMLEPHRNGRTNGRIAFVEPSRMPDSQRSCAARRVIRRNRRPFETTLSSY